MLSEFPLLDANSSRRVTCSLLGWDPTKYSASFGVGEPNANCEAKIMAISEDSSGNQTFTEITERGPEHRGELWCRGPNIMKGYWKNEKATQGTFSPDGERWLRTEIGRASCRERV